MESEIRDSAPHRRLGQTRRRSPGDIMIPAGAPRTGIWLFPSEPAPAMVDLACRAESLGLDEFWLGDEGPAREPFAILAAAATRTERITLAVGVTNPYVRAPALTVTTALTIHELSQGRMMLGVGAGGQLSLGPFGLELLHPVAAIREFIEVGRFVIAGESGLGYRRADDAIDGSVAATAMPTYVGARGPRLNRLASALADGAFVAGLPPFRYDEVIGWARSERNIDIALYPGVAFTEAAVEAQRPLMIWGLVDTPPAVRERLHLDHGEVLSASRALADGDEGPARRVVSDDIVAELILTGSPTSVGERLAMLVRRHDPASIGLALGQHDPEDIDRAAEAMQKMRTELEHNT